METKELNEVNYNHYWNKMQQLKFSIYYLGEHHRKSTVIDRIINISTIGVTAISTSIWMSWYSIKLVCIICAVIIYFFQAVSLFSHLLPYKKRKEEISKMVAEYSLLYNNMELDWGDIFTLRLTNEEMAEKLRFYSKSIIEIENKYLKEDSLPQRKKIISKAQEQTQLYFENLKKIYNGDKNNEY